MKRALLSLLYPMILVWIFAVGPMCWILRDGLGPDSIESNGTHAIYRFLFTFYWVPVLLMLIAFGMLLRIIVTNDQLKSSIQ